VTIFDECSPRGSFLIKKRIPNSWASFSIEKVMH
jgi:hypothetical protein